MFDFFQIILEIFPILDIYPNDPICLHSNKGDFQVELLIDDILQNFYSEVSMALQMESI